MVMFAANPYADGRRKHSVLNTEATGWFVWNMATYDLREAVNISAMEWPDGVDEFEKAGMTKAPCLDAPGPRVAESPAHFECRYLSTTRLKGNSAHGWVDVVFGEVTRIHVKDEVIKTDGKLDIPRIRPLARLGYYEYTSVTETFEMPIPGATEAAAAGLEGKA
jgi:flavin reductase (DIM6/NTAB) family NADH-FMN oxidoreductase RutF